ncbi:MAG TPA: hypothetical protein VKK81_12765 [Candidatus Binatia bacterium]|nr:hypothetical protein [Candidatus Binatia bacterium]
MSKTLFIAVIVSAIWAVVCVNAFTYGLYLSEQGCEYRGEPGGATAGWPDVAAR